MQVQIICFPKFGARHCDGAIQWHSREMANAALQCPGNCVVLKCRLEFIYLLYLYTYMIKVYTVNIYKYCIKTYCFHWSVVIIWILPVALFVHVTYRRFRYLVTSDLHVGIPILHVLLVGDCFDSHLFVIMLLLLVVNRHIC